MEIVTDWFGEERDKTGREKKEGGGWGGGRDGGVRQERRR